jgi:hypothetical protein
LPGCSSHCRRKGGNLGTGSRRQILLCVYTGRATDPKAGGGWPLRVLKLILLGTDGR